jgi:hypothetical protein
MMLTRISSLLEFYDLVREGKQEMVSEDVRKLLDQTPTNVEGFLHKHLIDVSLFFALLWIRLVSDRYA